MKKTSKLSVQRDIELMVVVMGVYLLLMDLGTINQVSTIWGKRIMHCLLYARRAVPIVIAMLIQRHSIEGEFKFSKNNIKNALITFLTLEFSLIFYYFIFGSPYRGMYALDYASYITYRFFYYILFVGIVEELVFRVYLCDTIAGWFKNNERLGDVFAIALSSLAFGLSHIINGNWGQVFWTMIVGLILSVSRRKMKTPLVCLAVAHGLYDFSIFLGGCIKQM